ncbi:MAG: hypothetical protein DRK00_08550 [Thermoprotei archaeon]|nr:MAG: hypothetical protein DRK00_08550 [Thermoprotei archaeon]
MSEEQTLTVEQVGPNEGEPGSVRLAEHTSTLQLEAGYPPLMTVDEEAGAVYIYFGERREVKRTVETGAILLIDLDSEDNVVGLEILPDKKGILKFLSRLSQSARRLSV